MESLLIKEIDGVLYINATPNDIYFEHESKVIELPQSGYIINAYMQETTVKYSNGIEFVRENFIKDKEGTAFLKRIKEDYPNAIVIGSITAAQAYPGEVVALTPCKICNDISHSEKRMNIDKFLIY